jgi:transposase-like protein
MRRKSMSNRKRPRGQPSNYPVEFQRDAGGDGADEGRSIVEVGDAIGVRESTLRNWVAKARRGRSAAAGLSVAERAELGRRRILPLSSIDLPGRVSVGLLHPLAHGLHVVAELPCETLNRSCRSPV